MLRHKGRSSGAVKDTQRRKDLEFVELFHKAEENFIVPVVHSAHNSDEYPFHNNSPRLHYECIKATCKCDVIRYPFVRRLRLKR